MFLCFVMLILTIYILLERSRRRLDPVDRVYLRFADKLASKGFERNSGEGVWSYCERASLFFPENANDIRNITQLYDDLRYAGEVRENIGNSQGVGGTLSQRQKRLKAHLKQKVRCFRLKPRNI